LQIGQSGIDRVGPSSGALDFVMEKGMLASPRQRWGGFRVDDGWSRWRAVADPFELRDIVFPKFGSPSTPICWCLATKRHQPRGSHHGAVMPAKPPRVS